MVKIKVPRRFSCSGSAEKENSSQDDWSSGRPSNPESSDVFNCTNALKMFLHACFYSTVTMLARFTCGSPF